MWCIISLVVLYIGNILIYKHYQKYFYTYTGKNVDRLMAFIPFSSLFVMDTLFTNKNYFVLGYCGGIDCLLYHKNKGWNLGNHYLINGFSNDMPFELRKDVFFVLRLYG